MIAAQHFLCRSGVRGIATLLGVSLLVACGKPDATDRSVTAPPATAKPCTIRHVFPIGALSKGDEQLFSAVEAGDSQRVEQAIGEGANVNASGSLKRTPLFSAAFCDRPAVASLLIDKSGQVNVKDANGMSLLHAAVIIGGADSAKLLIAKGADINMRDAAGHTPLHVAAATDQLAMVELLLERGANVSLRDQNGMTAASLASANGHKEAEATIRKWQETHKGTRQK